MKTYALVKDYGSHKVVDSIDPNLTKLEYDRANLLSDYRKKGYHVDHCVDGSLVLRKQIGTRPASPYGSDNPVDIPVNDRIVLRIEERTV